MHKEISALDGSRWKPLEAFPEESPSAISQVHAEPTYGLRSLPGFRPERSLHHAMAQAFPVSSNG